MKMGIDIHGVIDTYPDMFSRMSHMWTKNGNEVHIITGSMFTYDVQDLLTNYNISYTHFFSISDYLIDNNYVHHFDDENNPWFDEDVWNRQKGLYAERAGIDIHYDDSLIYGKYFPESTVYFHMR